VDFATFNLLGQLLPDINPDNVNSFGDLFNSIYTWSLAVVGLAVFIQFLRAGWLYLTAAGNASKAGEARTLMTNAVVGVILLFSAVLLLNTINPDLKKLDFMLNKDQVGSSGPPGGGTVQSITIDPRVARQDLTAAGITTAQIDLEGIRRFEVTELQDLNGKCGSCGFEVIGFDTLGGGSRITIKGESGALGTDGDLTDAIQNKDFIGIGATGERYRDTDQNVIYERQGDSDTWTVTFP